MSREVSMQVTVEPQPGGAAVVTLAGRLDLLSAARVRQELAAAVAAGHHRLVVDLAAVEFIDSTGLGSLVSGLKSTRLAGGDLRLARMRPGPETELARHRRHQRLVAVGADSDLHLAREIDAVHEFEKAVHEVLARLLAVGDDVDAAILLQLERQHGGVALGVVERRALEPPRRP